MAEFSWHSMRYCSGLPSVRFRSGFLPCNCTVTRTFSVHNNWFLCSTGIHKRTAEYISSMHCRYGSGVPFPARTENLQLFQKKRTEKSLFFSLPGSGAVTYASTLRLPNRFVMTGRTAIKQQSVFSAEKIKSVSMESCLPCPAGLPFRPVRAGGRSYRIESSRTFPIMSRFGYSSGRDTSGFFIYQLSQSRMTFFCFRHSGII